MKKNRPAGGAKPSHLQEVARSAGVSLMTVSRALRNLPSVAPETRDRIQAIAAEMGYRPNPTLSEIMSEIGRGRGTNRGRGALAWLNHRQRRDFWTCYPFTRPFHDGVIRRAQELGYAVDEIHMHDPAYPRHRIPGILRARGIQGVILTPDEKGKFFEDVDYSRFALSSTAHRSPFHSISDDTQANFERSWREVRMRGYTRPGLILEEGQLDWPSDLNTSVFLYLSRELRVADRIPPLFLPRTFTLWERGQRVSVWLKKTKPDVVIGMNDHLIEWAQAAGRSVPKDLGIVHLNVQRDVHEWSGITPPLAHKGIEIVNLVTAQIFHNEYGLPRIKRHILVAGQWTDGKTLPMRGSRGPRMAKREKFAKKRKASR